MPFPPAQRAEVKEDWDKLATRRGRRANRVRAVARAHDLLFLARRDLRPDRARVMPEQMNRFAETMQRVPEVRSQRFFR